jgi:hypothetical protein
LDNADNVITVGYNESAVVITSDKAAESAEFFTIPETTSKTGILNEGEMRFQKINLIKDKPYSLTFTAAGSYPDIVLFNHDGTFNHYYPVASAAEAKIDLPAPDENVSYYIGVWADDGAVTSYNLTFTAEGDLDLIKEDFSNGLDSSWSVSGPVEPVIVQESDGNDVLKFNATDMHSGDRSSISRTIVASVDMGLSFDIKTDIGTEVSTALVLYIDGKKKASYNGLDGSWSTKSFVLEAGEHELKWVLEIDSDSYYPSATNTVKLDNITIVPDITDSVIITPRGTQETFVGGYTIQYSAQALRSDGSVREGVSFTFSGSGVNASTGLFTPTTTGDDYIITASADGKQASSGVLTVHPANYLRKPYTYPGTGKTYQGYSGNEGSLTTGGGGVTVTYPAVTTFSADGFFTLEGTVDNSATYNYAYVAVYKGTVTNNDNQLQTYYLIRDNFKTRIWLRFGSGIYTIQVRGLSSINLSSDLGAEGDWVGSMAWGGNPITFTVNNTANDDVSEDGTTPDKRFIYPSYIMQSDDFLVANLVSHLTFGLTDPVAKIKAIHDYLVANTVYDAVSLSTPKRKKQDAHTVLTTRYHIDAQYEPTGHYLAVCEGYANASGALIRAAGIETRYQTSKNMNHGWNHIYVNGDWKLYDATWDDPVQDPSTTGDHGPTYIGYDYFLIGLTGVDNNHYGDTTEQGRFITPGSRLPWQKGVPDGWY